MLQKKGDIEIQQIIYFLIGLVVLIALIYIFRTQIAQFISTLAKFGDVQPPSLEHVVGK